MTEQTKLSKTLNHRRLTRQQEAFCVLVAQGNPPTEAVEQIYPDNSAPSRYAGELMRSEKVTNRIEALENQRETIAALNRDSLTIKALDVADEAREDGKYSASISGLRLAGDLQGMLTQNPIAEQTVAFLQFLAGDKPAVGDVQVLGEGGSS